MCLNIYTCIYIGSFFFSLSLSPWISRQLYGRPSGNFYRSFHSIRHNSDGLYEYSSTRRRPGCLLSIHTRRGDGLCAYICLHMWYHYFDFNPSLPFFNILFGRVGLDRIEQTVIANISTCGSKFDTEIGLFVDGSLIAFNDDDMEMTGDTAVFFCDQSDGATQSALQNVVLSKQRTYIIAVVFLSLDH